MATNYYGSNSGRKRSKSFYSTSTSKPKTTYLANDITASDTKSGEFPLWTLLNSLSSVGGAVKQQVYNWTDNKLDWKDIPLAESLVQGAKGQVNAWKDGALDLNDIPGIGALSTIGRESVTGKQLLQERFGASDWKDEKLGETKHWWQAIDPIDLAGFGIDVFTDPLSYVSGGGAAAVKAGRAAQQAKIVELASKYGVEVAKKRNVVKMGQELASKVGTKKASELKETVNPSLVDKFTQDLGLKLRNEVTNAGKAAREATQNKLFGISAPFSNKVATFGSKPEWAKVKDTLIDAPTAEKVTQELMKKGYGEVTSGAYNPATKTWERGTKDKMTEYLQNVYGIDSPSQMTSQMLRHYMENEPNNLTRGLDKLSFKEVTPKEPKVKTGNKKVKEPKAEKVVGEVVVREPKKGKVSASTLNNDQRAELVSSQANQKELGKNLGKLKSAVSSTKSKQEDIDNLVNTLEDQLRKHEIQSSKFSNVKEFRALNTGTIRQAIKELQDVRTQTVRQAEEAIIAGKQASQKTRVALGKEVQRLVGNKERFPIVQANTAESVISKLEKEFNLNQPAIKGKRGRKKMVSPSKIGKKDEVVTLKPEVAVVKPEVAEPKVEVKKPKAVAPKKEPAKRGRKASTVKKEKPITKAQKLDLLLSGKGFENVRNGLKVPQRNIPETVEDAVALYDKQQADLRTDILRQYNKFKNERAKTDVTEVVTEREQSIRDFLKANPELDEKLVRDTFGKRGDITLDRFKEKTTVKISKREQDIQDLLKSNKDINEETARKAFGKNKPVTVEQYKKYVDTEAKKASRVEAYQLEQEQLEYMRKLPLKLNELQLRKLTDEATNATKVADHLVYNVQVGFEGLFNKIGKPKEFSKFLTLTTQPRVGEVSVRFKMLDGIMLKATNTKAVANGVVDFSAEIPEELAVDFIKNIDSITIPQKLLKNKGYKQLKDAFPDAEEIVNANGSVTIKPNFKVAEVVEKARYRPETIALMRAKHAEFKSNPQSLINAYRKAYDAGKLVDNYEYKVRFGFNSKADLDEFLKPYLIKNMIEAKVPLDDIAKQFDFVTKKGVADRKALVKYLQDVEDAKLGVNKKKELSYKSDKEYAGDSNAFLGGNRDDKRLAFNQKQPPAMPNPLDKNFRASVNNEEKYVATQTRIDNQAQKSLSGMTTKQLDDYITETRSALYDVGIEFVNPKYLPNDAKVIAQQTQEIALQVHATRKLVGDTSLKGLKFNVSPLDNPNMLANYNGLSKTIFVTPKGRFAIAHEIGHFLADRMADKTGMEEVIKSLKGTTQFTKAMDKIRKYSGANVTYWKSDNEVFARAFEEAVLHQTGIKTSLKAGEALGLNGDQVSQIMKAVGVNEKFADDVFTEGKNFLASKKKQMPIFEEIISGGTYGKKNLRFQQDMGGTTAVGRLVGSSKMFNARSLGSKNSFVNTFGRDVSLTNVELQGGKARLVEDLTRMDKLTKGMSQSELESVAFVVEDVFPKGMSKAEYFKANGIDGNGVKRVEKFAEEFAKIMDELGVTEREVGLLKDLRRNYFPHIYQLSDSEAEAIFKELASDPKLKGLRGRSQKNGFSNERKGFQTMSELSDYIDELKVKIKEEVNPDKVAKLKDRLEKLEKTMKMKPIDVLAKRYSTSIRSTINKRLFNKFEKSGLLVKKGTTSTRDDLIRIDNREKARLLGLEIGDRVQKDVFEGLKKMDNIFTDEGLNKFLQNLDSIHSIWKRAITTVIPRHYVTNMIGHIFNNALAGVEVDSYTESARLMRAIKKGTLSKEDKQFIRFAQERGVLGQGFLSDFQRIMKYDVTDKRIGDKIAEGIGKVANKATLGAGSKYVAGLEKVGQLSDDFSRLAHFYDVYKKTGNLELAADSVKKYLFNYKELSTADRVIRAGAIPFWTWMRNNIPLQLEKLFSEPRFALTWFKLKEAMQGDVTQSDAPAWANESGFIAGNYVYNPQLPLTDLTRIIDTPRNVLKEIGASLNPTLRMPTEIALNKQFFSDKAISPTWSENPNKDYFNYIAKNAGPVGAIPTKEGANIFEELRKLVIPGITQHTYPKEGN